MVVDALSRIGVPKVAMPLIADLDRMGVSVCYACTSREETQLSFESPVLESVHEVQQHNRLIQDVCKRIGVGTSKVYH